MSDFTGRLWPRMVRILFLALLFLSLISPAMAAYGSGKKSKFLAAYPILFKFFLFWWCIFVFVVMGIYILDHLMFRRFGPAKVAFSAERIFKSSPSGGREAFWAQLADPTAWSMNHPVLQTADIRMVRCGGRNGDSAGAGGTANGDADSDTKAAAGESSDTETTARTEADSEGPAPSTKLQPISLQPLSVGLGFILRHKESDGGPRAGSFFCTRECTTLDKPAEGTWRMIMRTVEVGNGYPFNPETEETEVEMDAPGEDGSVRCVVTGFAAVNSRIFRWWNGLELNARLGAETLLEAVESEVLSAKKKD